MPGITGQGLTFNLPNYVGEIFSVTPTDTPFLSAIGGLTGGESVSAPQFQWQGYDLRDPSQNTRIEGADAPDAENRVRFNVSNVVEIHQETVDVSYTKQAATGLHSGLNIAGSNPVTNELDWQIQQMLKQVARDIEYSFIQGTYQNPVDNTTPRKTRGILEAIETNVVTNATPAEMTETMVLDLMQDVWDNGGIQEQETATVVVNSTQKRKLTKIFITDKGYTEESRTVGGVNVQTIETDFGRLNIMLNRYMPQDQLAVVSLEECAPRFLLIPNKGFLFIEPLAKTGATDKSQIYGEVGLKYGNEKAHGKITGLL
ncbi:SU10 major capsid protein [Metabacillus sp. HB246100]